MLRVDLRRGIELVVRDRIALAERARPRAVDRSRRGVHETTRTSARASVEQPERRQRIDAVELEGMLGVWHVGLCEVNDRVNRRQRDLAERSGQVERKWLHAGAARNSLGVARACDDLVAARDERAIRCGATKPDAPVTSTLTRLPPRSR